MLKCRKITECEVDTHSLFGESGYITFSPKITRGVCWTFLTYVRVEVDSRVDFSFWSHVTWSFCSNNKKRPTVAPCLITMQVYYILCIYRIKMFHGKPSAGLLYKLYLGHWMKVDHRVCHLAQFIPPFVYSSFVNAVVCMLICSSRHTSALGILKSE